MKDLNIIMSKEAFLTIIDGKLCVDDKVFEHHELRECKEYLQQMNYKSSQFIAKNDDDIDKLHTIIEKMGELSPEAAGRDIESFYLN
ncbi:MAG: hypothetical protein CMK23_05580 [Porticoccaceae bacterium]|nr:hypothetical protein [Porticoccaceae bacterium]|tara:strand:- start:3801 stop:4061 length:261 start_codon:yes stop_codon:yes gene_type:complete